MKDRKGPRDASAEMKPQRQTGEQFGSVHTRQRKGNRIPERSDTPRGSEPETRGASGPRG